LARCCSTQSWTAYHVAEGKIPGPWGPLNAEAVIAANPDAIFIAGSSWLNRPKAVKTGYEATPEITRASLAPYAERPVGPISRL
jgi:iron complex transport system substrate-binding protein